MFARLRLILEIAENAVVVPVEAIREEAGETFVFVVEEKKAVQRSVETGIEAGGRVQVLSGVAPGEAVIVAGAQGLRHGDLVAPRALEPSGALPGGSPGKIPGERSGR